MIGRVRMVIRSSMAEKLIARAMEEGIRFLSVSRINGREISVWISHSHENAFTKLLARLSISYRIYERKGAIAAADFFKKHFALFLFGFAAIAFLVFLSGRIWFIDISMDNDRIYQALYDAGIHTGVRKSEIDPKNLSRSLAARFSEYAYVGVSVSGVYLFIEPHSENPAPDVYIRTDVRNLIADSDGIIESVHVSAGQALVSPGDTVKKGDILILGQERASKDGDMTLVRAEGSVKARTWTEGNAVIPLSLSEKAYTGRESTVKTLVCPYFEKTLSGENPFSHSDSILRFQPVGGMFLPVKIVYDTYREYTLKPLNIPETEATAAAEALSKAKARGKCKADAEETGGWAEIELITESGESKIRAKYIAEWTREIARGG